jgi:F0F1-type ATP synthase assembly protein I
MSEPFASGLLVGIVIGWVSMLVVIVIYVRPKI